jgi:protein ImuB
MDVPRVALRRRFGKDFIGALQALLGEHPSELPSYRPPPRFDARIELPAEITNQAALRFPLRRLIGDLAAFAATRDGGIERFVVRFEHDEAAPTEVAIGLLAPEREVEALFEVTKLKLERTTLAAPVTAVGVRAGAPSPFVPAGRDLFDSRPAETLPWEKLRERLRACLGEAAVYEFAADPDPRPEFASRCRGRETSVEQARELPLSRPAWLLSRPMPLFASPARILVGPERIETGWWDGGDIRRDYYVVELASGQRAWAFAAPGEREHFMLHGWFA